MTTAQKSLSLLWLTACIIAVCTVFLFVPSLPQDESFHLFADGRTLFGIPNFFNVISNLPFLIVGVAGLWKARTASDRVLFTGVLLTALGSAYYHLAPSDARLIWDRIPMTIIFMAFLSCALEDERILLPCLALGIGSVIWWRLTGDLRPYGIVKFGPILLLVPLMLRSPQRRYITAIVLLFGVAQVFELADHAVYSRFPLSGHTIKHFIAGLATYGMLAWRARSSCPSIKSPPPESSRPAAAPAGR